MRTPVGGTGGPCGGTDVPCGGTGEDHGGTGDRCGGGACAGTGDTAGWGAAGAAGAGGFAAGPGAGADAGVMPTRTSASYRAFTRRGSSTAGRTASVRSTGAPEPSASLATSDQENAWRARPRLDEQAPERARRHPCHQGGGVVTGPAGRARPAAEVGDPAVVARTYARRSMSGYSEQDRRRWAPEPPKRRGRTPFERDRARVLHSAALRRLAAKTQVVEAVPGDDPDQHSPRTRLTHSLECAQIGRELGRAFGCDPDLVETACLSHDLGHPPFGHNGETVLDQVAGPCGGFEGNAQSLRLLTRLEAKSFAPDGRSVGLNLTRAALDAAMKYPWPRGGPGPDARAKYGAYDDDLPVLAWVRAGAPEGRPCFEAQVMDWSDDVAYSVHDLEDGLHAGHVHLGGLADPAERRAVCALTAGRYCDAGAAELEERFAALLAEPYWPGRYDATLRGLAALKNLASELIGRFCRAAERATRAAYGDGPLTRYAADLIVPRAQRLECALLKGVAARYVMGRADHGARQARRRDVLAELADALTRTAPDGLDPVFRACYTEAADDRARLRVVVDQIASLTDTSALARHRAVVR